MAGVYHVYTMTKGVPCLVKYKCEKCEKENVTIYLYPVSSSYDDKALLSSTKDKKKQDAIQNLDEKIASAKKDIAKYIKERDYKSIHIDCKCGQCNTIPTWAYPKNGLDKALGVIKNLSLVIAILCFLFLCLVWSDGGKASILPAIELLIPAVVVWIVNFIRDKIHSDQIKKMDPVYYPTIVLLEPNANTEIGN